MATLQKIRTQAGLLVAIVIGLALFAFILGDLFQSGSSIMQRNQMELGSIDGETVQYPEFQKKVEELGEIYRSNTGQAQLDEATWVQVREQTWQDLIRDKVMGDVYKNLGLGVSPDEMFDLIQGNNPHAIIQQIFTNPETGQFDRSAVINFLKNLETGVTPEQRSYWLYLEKQILNERLSTKYNNLINKALYVTRQEAQESLAASNKKVNVELVGLRHSLIADSTVKVTTDELAAYYNKHKDQYKDEKTRNIEFVTFTVTPSPADYSTAEKWINEIKSDFAATTENEQFVNSNSDVSFNDTWYKPAVLSDSLSAWVSRQGTMVGEVYGPYFESNSYKLAKLHASQMMPDSVEARHILLRVNSQAEVQSVQALADSLKGVIEKGGDFAALARLYSTDTGSALNGGDLGWFQRGMMVKPFEDAAFSSKVNEVKVVGSQFGLHIIQTTKLGVPSRQVQLAILERSVTPSTQTYQAIYAQAAKFANEKDSKSEFDAAVAEEKLTKRAAILHENDIALLELENPRPLVRAAFSAKVGNVLKNTDGSTIFELGSNFVIATLAGATEEGIAPLENVKQRVELAVVKEKKAALLADRLSKAAEGKTDLYAIAPAVGSQVTVASGLNFNTVTLPDYGMEPAVIGTAVTVKPNVVSAPVKGNSAVFLVKVTSTEEGTDTNVEAERQRLAQSTSFRANMQSFDVLKKSVEIEDKRPKFY
jgi:peptidyl-prolyl cis-trans isomerase D